MAACTRWVLPYPNAAKAVVRCAAGVGAHDLRAEWFGGWQIRTVEYANRTPRPTGASPNFRRHSWSTVGHTMVRVEDEGGTEVGLFVTTYVDPAHRSLGLP